MPIEPRERRGAEAAHDSRPIAEQNFQQEILFAFPGAWSLGRRLVTEPTRAGPIMAHLLISSWISRAIRRSQVAVIVTVALISPGVVGVVVSTQNRDQWILPGAAMPFQARYLLSFDRTINHGGYRLSSAPGG